MIRCETVTAVRSRSRSVLGSRRRHARSTRCRASIQKILYVHPPLAFAAYLGFVADGRGGALYLWARATSGWDRFAAASAEVGVLFCTLVHRDRSDLGAGTWGQWWTWDLRLTLTLLLFLVYLSYLLLRSFTEGSERTARFAAVYGIAGLAIVTPQLLRDRAGWGPQHPPREPPAREPRARACGRPFWLGVAGRVRRLRFTCWRCASSSPSCGPRGPSSSRWRELEDA